MMVAKSWCLPVRTLDVEIFRPAAHRSTSSRMLLRRRQATVPEKIRVTLESTRNSHYLSRIHVIGISGRETSGHTQAKLYQLVIVVQFGLWTLRRIVI